MQNRLPTVAAAALILAATVLTSTSPAATRPDARAVSAPASSASVSVRLQVSTHRALQLHGVLFDARTSGGNVAAYVFDYGDGISEASYQPLAMHGYRTPGVYQARVGVIDTSGQTSLSARVTIRVRDGIPPVVRIDNPRPGRRLRRGSGAIRFAGSAHDSGGVARVQLAIELVSSFPHLNAHGGCIWYDGHQGLVLTACATPYFFNVRFHGGRWSLRIGRPVTLPVGSYVIRVRAIDRAGNISHYYAVSLRTILPFKLAR